MDPKPKILAFHGSGSNSMIHTVQLARLTRVFGSEFEIESLSAPFPSQAGPGVLPFFDGCGPYKRWLSASDTAKELKDGPHISTMPSEVEELIRSTVKRIRDSGGEVVGLIGFSQGTRVVTGLLKCAEIIIALKEKGEDVDELDWCDWGFGISICGSSPPPFIAQSVSAALDASKLSEDEKKELLESKIAIPAYHILGNQDEFKAIGKRLVEQCYEVAEGKSTVKEVDIGHFYPVQPAENEQLGKWAIEVFKKAQA